MRIERHVFGSFKGYTTLAASPGVGPEECRLLEGAAYGFGQSDDKRYLRSLRSSPAYFTRALRGRRGVTRVLQGAPDDNGRPTLLMVTCLVGQREWDAELCGDVGLLLREDALWSWTPGEQIAAIEQAFPPPLSSVSRRSAGRVAALVSEIERRWNGGAGITVSAGEFSLDEMRAIEILIPPQARGQFTSAYRSLGAQLAVTVNALAAEAPAQKISFTAAAGAPATPSKYATILLAAGLADGKLPIGEAMTYRGFGAGMPRHEPSPDPPIAPPPPTALGRQTRRLPIVAGSVVLASVGFGVGFISGIQYGRRGATNSAARPSPSAAVATTQALSPAVTASESAVQPATTTAPTTTQTGGAAVASSGPATQFAGTTLAAASPTPAAAQPAAAAPSTTGTTTQRTLFNEPLPDPKQIAKQAAERKAEADKARQAMEQVAASIRAKKGLDVQENRERVRLIADAMSRDVSGVGNWTQQEIRLIQTLKDLIDRCDELRSELDKYSRLRTDEKKKHYPQLVQAEQKIEPALLESGKALGEKKPLVCPEATALRNRFGDIKVPA